MRSAKTFVPVICCVFVLLVASTPSNADPINLVQNGSFEVATVTPGTFITLGPGSTAITGWTVGGVSIDYIGTYWQAQNGARSLDMSGLGAGSILQTAISTSIGQEYQISLWISGNPDNTRGLKSLDVLVNGVLLGTATYNTAVSMNTRSNMLWTQVLFEFTATTSSTSLGFASGTTTPYGPALDNVSVTAVPEPSTLVLLGAALAIIGLAVRWLY